MPAPHHSLNADEVAKIGASAEAVNAQLASIWERLIAAHVQEFPPFLHLYVDDPAREANMFTQAWMDGLAGSSEVVPEWEQTSLNAMHFFGSLNAGADSYVPAHENRIEQAYRVLFGCRVATCLSMATVHKGAPHYADAPGTFLVKTDALLAANPHWDAYDPKLPVLSTAVQIARRFSGAAPVIRLDAEVRARDALYVFREAKWLREALQPLHIANNRFARRAGKQDEISAELNVLENQLINMGTDFLTRLEVLTARGLAMTIVDEETRIGRYRAAAENDPMVVRLTSEFLETLRNPDTTPEKIVDEGLSILEFRSMVSSLDSMGDPGSFGI